MIDTNLVLRTYLLADVPLDTLVSGEIYCPRAPENALLPNVTFFTRGGRSSPYIPDLPNPSAQIDCWADSSVDAREVYRAVYDALQGIQNVSVAGGYVILSAIEEVHGQDLVDTDIPGRFRCLSFWDIIIR